VARCIDCGAEGARWAQFAAYHCLACDSCTKAHGGWRREDGKPLASNFPKLDPPTAAPLTMTDLFD
jgi:hypothetical protein